MEKKEEPGSELEATGSGQWKVKTGEEAGWLSRRRRIGVAWPQPGRGGTVAGQDWCDSRDPDSGTGWPHAPWTLPSAALSPVTVDFSSLRLRVLKREMPLILEPVVSGWWGVSCGPHCHHCFVGTPPGSPVSPLPESSDPPSSPSPQWATRLLEPDKPTGTSWKQLNPGPPHPGSPGLLCPHLLRGVASHPGGASCSHSACCRETSQNLRLQLLRKLPPGLIYNS